MNPREGTFNGAQSQCEPAHAPCRSSACLMDELGHCFSSLVIRVFICTIQMCVMMCGTFGQLFCSLPPTSPDSNAHYAALIVILGVRCKLLFSCFRLDGFFLALHLWMGGDILNIFTRVDEA